MYIQYLIRIYKCIYIYIYIHIYSGAGGAPTFYFPGQFTQTLIHQRLSQDAETLSGPYCRSSRPLPAAVRSPLAVFALLGLGVTDSCSPFRCVGHALANI